MTHLFLTLALLTLSAGEKRSNLDKCTDDLHQVALRFSPPAKAWRAPTHPETDEAMAARYREIATDICEAVLKSKPIEGFDRKGTARVTMAMAIGESALAKDADVGPCYRKKPYRTRCDGGLAVGVLQVQLPPRQRKAYFLDRDLLVGRALRGLRGSFAACRNNPINERLAAYASGSCTREAGKRASRRRWKLVQRVLVWSK